MIRAVDYLEAKKNLGRNYVLSEAQLHAWNAMQIAPKLCGYEGCANELGPRVDGEHRKIGSQPVCEECYFDSFGEELDAHPILPPRLRRRIA
jgi:hypothetical protein